MRTVAYYTQHASVQNKLQSLAARLHNAKALVARGEAEIDRIRQGFYELADAMFGPDSYVIYECRGELEHFRMAREVQEPRTFDIDALRERLTPEQFAAVTKTVVDVKALEVAESRHAVDSHVIAECTHYGRRPNLIWATTGARSEIKPQPGQIAVVASQHPVSAVQER